MFGLEGNKDPEQPEKVRNTRHFLVLDDRKFGRTAKIPLFYDTDTGILDEPPEGFLEDDVAQRLSEWTPIQSYREPEKVVAGDDEKEETFEEPVTPVVIDEEDDEPF